MRFILCLLFFSAQAFAALPRPQWEEIAAPGLKKMLTLKEVPGAFVSLLEDDGEFILGDFNAKIYTTALPETREMIHSFIGIKDYKVLHHEAQRNTDSWTVKIEGSYLKNSTPMNFCELHTFTAKSFTQKQAFYPRDKSQAVLESQGCFELIKRVIE